jgi:hypothetical protein
VYQITNRVTGRCYIGLTTAAIGTRWRNHRNTMLNGQHPSKTMTADLVAFGVESFDIDELERVETVAEAEVRERHWMTQAIADGVDLYNTRRPSR